MRKLEGEKALLVNYSDNSQQVAFSQKHILPQPTKEPLLTVVWAFLSC